MASFYDNARKLRGNQTVEERLLWGKLRGKQVLGKRFHRQKPIVVCYQGEVSRYIADFYCREAKLIIALDGNQHEYQKEYDEVRTELMKKKGLKVIRFDNRQVNENIDLVLVRIKNSILENIR